MAINISKLLLNVCFLPLLMLSSQAVAEGGKLLGTAGVSAIEGANGGGLIPWAIIGSYATQDEIGVNVFNTEARVDDYNLSVHGASVGFYNRVELSFAHQDFFSDALNRPIRQNISSLKIRLLGDLIYDDLPVVSLGIQYKNLTDDEVIGLVGADDDSGIDTYMSVAKAWINGPFSRTTFVNANLRYSEANEIGLLGFGGDKSGAKLSYELAGGAFLTNSLAVGIDYRQKRGHLSAVDEDDWLDVFVAWFPNKNFSVTAAYLDLGEIVGQDNQTGFYVSIQGAFSTL